MVAQFTAIDALYLSDITLALFKDTGWYTSVDQAYS
jgi:hypothetical protein